ncbi:MAG: hypothetical protein GDA35_10595 [Hyphomonadaceae bacterium]|nr:hypothetical protein [Hyphomonadaceae bacterium]
MSDTADLGSESALIIAKHPGAGPENGENPKVLANLNKFATALPPARQSLPALRT